MTKKKESRQKQSLYSAGIPAVAPVENSVHCATPRWCNSANACKHDAVRARELLVELIDVIDLRGNPSPDRNFRRRKENKTKKKERHQGFEQRIETEISHFSPSQPQPILP